VLGPTAVLADGYRLEVGQLAAGCPRLSTCERCVRGLRADLAGGHGGVEAGALRVLGTSGRKPPLAVPFGADGAYCAVFARLKITSAPIQAIEPGDLRGQPPIASVPRVARRSRTPWNRPVAARGGTSGRR
jgi:hypothetical protein